MEFMNPSKSRKKKKMTTEIINNDGELLQIYYFIQKKLYTHLLRSIL